MLLQRSRAASYMCTAPGPGCHTTVADAACELRTFSSQVALPLHYSHISNSIIIACRSSDTGQHRYVLLTSAKATASASAQGICWCIADSDTTDSLKHLLVLHCGCRTADCSCICCQEISRKRNLLPRLEGGKPTVWASSTAESITQGTLQ